jgi:hypothetical protein
VRSKRVCSPVSSKSRGDPATGSDANEDPDGGRGARQVRPQTPGTRHSVDTFSRRRAGAQFDLGSPGRVAAPQPTKLLSESSRRRTGRKNAWRSRLADAAARHERPSQPSKLMKVNLDNRYRLVRPSRNLNVGLHSDPQNSVPALLVAPRNATEPSSENRAVFSGGHASNSPRSSCELCENRSTLRNGWDDGRPSFEAGPAFNSRGGHDRGDRA